ncbi:MAG TPA: amidohydrolase family protein [Candidatus Acidoferrales bacterium]|nr:amidohydrolase family protein [Candidatus Acidoferrales bacterium]
MATIDADAHVIETEHTWSYMTESEAQFRPRIVGPQNPTDTTATYWVIDGRLHPRTNVGKETPQEAREMRDIEKRLRHMDELGVDVQVLYPTLFLTPISRRAEVQVALYRSYNRWLAEIWRKAPDRLRWVVAPPLWNMEQAFAEMRFGKENGACGVFVCGLEAERRLSDPYFFPFYEEASRLDLPVCVHSGNASFTVHDFFMHDSGFAKFKLAVVGAFHAIIFDQIPERFPKLKFGFIEVSAQWLPYVVRDLGRRFRRRGRPLSENLLRDNRIYIACETTDDLAYVVQYAGEDHLVIGSDYGHADTSAEIEALRRLREEGKVPARIVDKILDANARALYGL